MGMYGPFAAVVNTVQTQQVTPNADRLFIVNQSIYDLVIGFGDQAPPVVATLTGDPWVATVPPGGQLVPIRRDLYGGGVFSGKVHILALDPTSGKLALTGTSSANTAYFLQSLQPGEAAPESYTIPQFQNLSSQPRMISVPIAAGIWGGNLTWTPGSQTIFAPVNWALVWPNTPQIQVYLHYVDFSWNGGTSCVLQVALEMVTLNSGGVVSTTPVMGWYQTDSKPPLVVNPARPLYLGQFNKPGGNSPSFRLQLHNIGSLGTLPAGILVNLWFDIDPNNAHAVPATGGGLAGIISGSLGAGGLY